MTIYVQQQTMRGSDLKSARIPVTVALSGNCQEKLLDMRTTVCEIQEISYNQNIEWCPWTSESLYERILPLFAIHEQKILCLNDMKIMKSL